MDKTISKVIDFLRFPMACAVVLLHTPGNYTNWSHYNFNDLRFFTLYDHVSLISNIICQIAVPIFFLISAIYSIMKPRAICKYYKKGQKLL